VTGIPTTYRYKAMRSRLEARWATFFDLIGWRWTYEPLDAEGYVPDFLIHGKDPMFIEIGPCISWEDYRAKSAKADGAVETLGRDILVLGVTPIAETSNNSWSDPTLYAGWLGEFFPAHTVDVCGDDNCSHGPTYGWDRAIWAKGSEGFGVYHESNSYDHRPHGDGHENPYGDERHLQDLWAQAGSRVQWKPAA
jgi:hypothetical protein